MKKIFLLAALGACEPVLGAAAPGMAMRVDIVGETYRGTVTGTVDGRPFSSGIVMTFTTRYEHSGDLDGSWQTASDEPGFFGAEVAGNGDLLLDLYDARQCYFVGRARHERGGNVLAGWYETPEGSICAAQVRATFTVARR